MGVPHFHSEIISTYNMTAICRETKTRNRERRRGRKREKEREKERERKKEKSNHKRAKEGRERNRRGGYLASDTDATISEKNDFEAASSGSCKAIA
jgi:Ni/Co efflux regulator RcnB